LPWTPAVFLDKAQELKRRLAVWHLDELGPVQLYMFLELQEAIRQTFRTIVMRGLHGPRPEPSLQLFPGVVSDKDKALDVVGTGFYNPPSDCDKQLTRWLLRDFVEHLPDAGHSEDAKFLRLKVDRILDCPANRPRPPAGEAEKSLLDEQNRQSDAGPHALIGGHPVAPELLDELVAAAGRLLQPGSIGAPLPPGSAGVHAGRHRADGAESPKLARPSRRGRKKADDETVEREAQLAAEWERARDSGVGYKPAFARDKGMALDDFEVLLNRVAKRKSRSDN
jgi:hypothetical protein